MWRRIDGPKFVCTTDTCSREPCWCLDVDGVASVYCYNCKAQIEAQDDMRHFGTSFTRRKPNGDLERIDPAEMFIEKKPEPKPAHQVEAELRERGMGAFWKR